MLWMVIKLVLEKLNLDDYNLSDSIKLEFYNDKKVQDVLDYNFNLLIDKTNIHNKFDYLFLNPLKKHIKNLE